MSDEALAEPIPLAEPTEARFSTRSLFIAMAVVAMLAALIGPLVRGFKPAEQVRVLAAWAAWLTLILAWVGYQVRQRFRAERIAGPTLLKLPLFDEKSGSASPARRWLNIFGAGFMSLIFMIVVIQVAVEAAARREMLHFLLMFGMWGLLSVWWAARIVTMFWWRSSIRFCEQGILWDRQVLRWNYIIQRDWSDSLTNVLELKGIDHRNQEVKWKVPVPGEQRQKVQTLLDESRPSADAAASGPSILELGRIPISSAVKNPNFPRYLAGLAVRFPVVVAVFIAIAAGPADIREFDGAIVPGIVLAFAISVVSWRWVGKQAGPPLVRLTGLRGFSEFLAYLGASAILYFAAVYLSRTSFALTSWPFYLLGLAFGWTTANTVRYLYPRHIDLRANGVSLSGELFWPWQQLRILRWDRDGNGKLVLARGWQRLAAKVPPEQREAVDAVLNDKLGDRTSISSQSG